MALWVFIEYCDHDLDDVDIAAPGILLNMVRKNEINNLVFVHNNCHQIFEENIEKSIENPHGVLDHLTDFFNDIFVFFASF